jgi:hypothetical protein
MNMFVKDNIMNIARFYLAKQPCNPSNESKPNTNMEEKKPNMQNTPTPKNMNDNFLLDLLGPSKPYCSIV